MSKRRGNNAWLNRQRADPYVAKAHTDGYRARSAYKLAQLDERDDLLAGVGCVVDLGAAPGAWSQYCRRRVPSARVLALDRLAIEPIDGVEILSGDFTSDDTLHRLLATLGDARPDLVLSDMAPNVSGVKSVDQAAIMDLAELTLDYCERVLADGGNAVIKVFQGAGFDALVGSARRCFKQVTVRKPDASRDASAEVYLVGRSWCGVRQESSDV
ncbi:RlmE family RNA methyltransferase [Salinisphaera orenii]|uniref:RlmE family RNA methyltransferase n=1 Tax=Salinisphaera orenii TaxID=856731 RepID=UPI000DBE1D64